MFPLSKCYNPRDAEELAMQWDTVCHHFNDASPQAEMRRWEYAMARRAEDEWRVRQDRPAGVSYDVGGAGSPFPHIAWTLPQVIDPHTATGTLQEYCVGGAQLGDAVFCLSVLEHIPDLDQFLYHLACLTAPGGLLFLTVDCCDLPSLADGWPTDNRHYSWLRERIFNPTALTNRVYFPLATLGFSYLGAQDWTYHTDCPGTNWGYSCASLALIKRA